MTDRNDGRFSTDLGPAHDLVGDLSMAIASHPRRMAERAWRFFRNVFGLDHGLPGHVREACDHRPGIVWSGLLVLTHLAVGSHDTLSLLGAVQLKPDWHAMHAVETGLTALVWLGHLLED